VTEAVKYGPNGGSKIITKERENQHKKPRIEGGGGVNQKIIRIRENTSPIKTRSLLC